jgi:hypothetical protein
VLLLLFMIFCPFPLKMESPGNLQPTDRAWVFSPNEGIVISIKPGLKSGSEVTKGQELFEMFDLKLAKDIRDLQAEIAGLQARINPGLAKNGDDKNFDANAATEARIKKDMTIVQLNKLRDRYNADLSRPGYFKIVAPKKGIILSNDDFRNDLVGKGVRPTDPLLQIGFTNRDHPKRQDWEVKLKIPQKHIGQVLHAFESLPPGAELDVDLLVMSKAEDGTFRAKLRKDKIAAQAKPEKDDNNEAEAVVMAWARVEARYSLNEKVLADLRKDGLPEALSARLDVLKDRVFEGADSFLREIGRVLTPDERKSYEGLIVDHACRADIPLDKQIPSVLLLSGSEVHTRIRCGNAPIGYALFYGVYEFLYEKVIFPLSWK